MSQVMTQCTRVVGVSGYDTVYDGCWCFRL